MHKNIGSHKPFQPLVRIELKHFPKRFYFPYAKSAGIYDFHVILHILAHSMLFKIIS